MMHFRTARKLSYGRTRILKMINLRSSFRAHQLRIQQKQQTLPATDLTSRLALGCTFQVMQEQPPCSLSLRGFLELKFCIYLSLVHKSQDRTLWLLLDHISQQNMKSSMCLILAIAWVASFALNHQVPSFVKTPRSHKVSGLGIRFSSQTLMDNRDVSVIPSFILQAGGFELCSIDGNSCLVL